MSSIQASLDQALGSWFELLTHWSSTGSLAAAAQHVLDLDGEAATDGADDLLQSYISQWSSGNFETLPPIVLLSNNNIRRQ